MTTQLHNKVLFSLMLGDLVETAMADLATGRLVLPEDLDLVFAQAEGAGAAQNFILGLLYNEYVREPRAAGIRRESAGAYRRQPPAGHL